VADLLTELIEFDYSEIPEERRPRSGNHWRCNVCGKHAADKYGIIGPHSSMWDESCMMHADEVPLLIGGARRG
jgi:hypothetical protein